MSYYNEYGNLSTNWTLESIKKEFENGTPIDEKDPKGNTLLHNVIDSHNKEEEKIETIRFLLNNGADINAPESTYGRSPIFHLVNGYSGINNILKLLVEYGANINAQDFNGKTVLFRTENLDTLEFLLSHGADFNLKNNDGKSFLDNELLGRHFYGRFSFKQFQFLTCLLEHGAKLDIDAENVKNSIEEIVLEEIECYDESICEQIAVHYKLIDLIGSLYPTIYSELGLDLIVNEKLGKNISSQLEIPSNSTTIIIPENWNKIKKEQFKDNTIIEEVIIHGNIRIIENQAFYGCTNLKQIVFLNNGVYIIEDEAFYNCKNIKEININQNTIIGKRAFADCYSLEKIHFTTADETTLRFVKNYETYNAKKKAEVPYHWGKEAFKNCINLISLSDFSVYAIGKACFFNCKKLQIVKGNIHNKIDDYAFWGCDSLKTFNGTYGKKIINYDDYNDYGDPVSYVINLGRYVFPFNDYDEFKFEASFYGYDSENGLYSEKVDKVLSQRPREPETNYWDVYGYSNNDYEDYSWDEDYIESTPEYWDNLYAKSYDYYDFLELDKINLPKNATISYVINPLDEISEYTNILKYSSYPRTIGLPPEKSFKHLRFVTFDNIDNIIDFTVRESTQTQNNFYTSRQNNTDVKSERFTFSGSGIEAIEIPPNIKDISDAFSYCSNLKKVVFGAKCKTENLASAFSHTNLENCFLPGTTNNLSETFSHCKNLKKIEFKSEPINLKILEKTFTDCYSLKDFCVPASVQVLTETFTSCVSLENIYIPEDSQLKEIDYDTFKNCISLKKIVIPKSVENISISAFSDCISLEEVIFLGEPENEEFIKRLFNDCLMLKKISYGGKEISLDKK